MSTLTAIQTPTHRLGRAMNDTSQTPQTAPAIGDVHGDPQALRRAFSCFPSGVIAICATVDGAPVGLAASSFTPVSLDPPLASICVQTTSSTWPVLRRATRLGVSVLAESQSDLCRQLSSKNGDRFKDLDLKVDASGAILIEGASLWLTCSLEDELPAGDHSIALLRIQGMQATPQVEPLIFHASSYRRLMALEAPSHKAS